MGRPWLMGCSPDSRYSPILVSADILIHQPSLLANPKIIQEDALKLTRSKAVPSAAGQFSENARGDKQTDTRTYWHCDFWTLVKCGRQNDNKSKDNFLIPIIPEYNLKKIRQYLYFPSYLLEFNNGETLHIFPLRKAFVAMDYNFN